MKKVSFKSRNVNQIITDDAFHMADVFLTQPLLVVAGSVAGSKWMSDDLYRLAALRNAFSVRMPPRLRLLLQIVVAYRVELFPDRRNPGLR
jgi:hypothetical protein